MLSSIIAWIAALFFLFMAGAFFVWALCKSRITPAESVAALGLTIYFLGMAWGAAALGGI